jgi:acetyl esterase
MPKTFTVTVDKPENGTISISPAIPADGKVAAGTVIKLTAVPNDGFALDSCYYYYNSGDIFGRLNIETTDPIYEITIDKDKGIGASFIEKEALKGFNVIQNIVYARPGVKKLKYDVFTPDGAKNLPCIIIIHGGGWSINTEDIMRGQGRELAKSGRYVVFSIDYRWIGTLDGDKKPNTIADIIEDVYSAIVHIREHAKQYGADANRIALTGDSAGGHLSAAAINMVNMIGDGGFGIKKGIYQYKPTYMPEGKSIELVRKELTAAIKAAAPSYGVFGGDLLKTFAADYSDADLKAVSPINHIPNIKERAVPQLLLRGTEDLLITDHVVKSYADALQAAGQMVEYVPVEGANHAFFDWKPDAATKATFKKYGVPCCAKMLEFFDKVFYIKK